MVENVEFLNHLRNGHLEKSAVTGIFRPSRSPTTAKTPLKVHLRLRFQNLGKPRTAGLCGRAAGACDCGPLSCFLFRPRKRLEKRRKRSHINASNASVTRTSRVSQTPLQTPIPYFPSMGTTRQKSSCRNRLQNGPHSLLLMKVVTHSPLTT